MTPRHAATLYLFAMFTSTGVASADEGRPTNYDQCITDSMKGVGSDVAARAIIASCRNQFPDTAPGEVVPASPAPAAAAPVAATESKSAAPAAAPQAVPAAAPQAAAPVVRDLTDAELAGFTRQNEAYRARFGFPFIICARLNAKDLISLLFRHFSAVDITRPRCRTRIRVFTPGGLPAVKIRHQ